MKLPYTKSTYTLIYMYSNKLKCVGEKTVEGETTKGKVYSSKYSSKYLQNYTLETMYAYKNC